MVWRPGEEAAHRAMTQRSWETAQRAAKGPVPPSRGRGRAGPSYGEITARNITRQISEGTLKYSGIGERGKKFIKQYWSALSAGQRKAYTSSKIAYGIEQKKKEIEQKLKKAQFVPLVDIKKYLGFAGVIGQEAARRIEALRKKGEIATIAAAKRARKAAIIAAVVPAVPIIVPKIVVPIIAKKVVVPVTKKVITKVVPPALKKVKEVGEKYEEAFKIDLTERQVSEYERIFGTKKASKIMIEKEYPKKVIVPISTWIGGERARAIEEQQKKVLPLIQQLQKKETIGLKKGWITPEGLKSGVKEAEEYQKLYKQYEKEQTKLEELPKPHPTRQFVRGVGELGVSIPMFPIFIGRAGAAVITEPTKVPMKVTKFGEEYYEFAKEEPSRAAGQIAAMVAIPTARKLPAKPKITIARFPKAKAIGFGIEITKKPHILKPAVMGEFYPGITIGKGAIKRVSIGKPKIKGEIFGEELFVPKTPFEAGIAARAIPKEALKITEARGVRHYTIKAGVKPKELKPIIRETLEQHGLKKSTDTVTTLLKKEKADLYGSTIQKAVGREVGEPGLARTPRDFDVKVINTKLFAKRAVKEINKAEDREAVILKGDKVIVKKTGEKLFDIHPKKEPITPGEYLGSEEYLYYGLKEEPLIKTAEGIRATTLSEQATRKIGGAMQITAKPRELITEAGLRVRGRIVPTHKGRVKDIADYYFAEKANIAGLKLKGKTTQAGKANVHLEKWLESWGKDMKKYTKDLYAKTVRKEGGEKAWLGTFEEKPYSPSQSYKVVSQLKYVAPVSVIPPIMPSVIPSITPSTVPSRIPSKIPSKIGVISPKLSLILGIPSKPSKVPFVPISKIPTKVMPSKIPPKAPPYEIPKAISIIPSKIKVPSKIPPPTPPYKPPLISLKYAAPYEVPYEPIISISEPSPRILKKRKLKKKKIPILLAPEIGAFRYGEITPVATPKEALGLLGVETNSKKSNNIAEFIAGK